MQIKYKYHKTVNRKQAWTCWHILLLLVCWSFFSLHFTHWNIVVLLESATTPSVYSQWCFKPDSQWNFLTSPSSLCLICPYHHSLGVETSASIINQSWSVLQTFTVFSYVHLFLWITVSKESLQLFCCFFMSYTAAGDPVL